MENYGRKHASINKKRQEVSRILCGLFGPEYRESPHLRLVFEQKSNELMRGIDQ